jgi:hypothetical protein
MKKIICPICNKDLTEALKLLNIDFQCHMNAHMEADNIKVFAYILKNVYDLPDDLRKIMEKRSKNIKKLHAYDNQLKNDEISGYAG